MSNTTAPSAAQPTVVSPSLRRYLYTTAGITGAAILIVEILGAKMLSPYVGTSHFVWTAQIAVTLFSLAAGYYFGGAMVDRSPRLSQLFLWIAIAAAYLGFVTLIIEPVTYQFLRFNLALGALLSSAVLFFIPLTLLAAVGPFLVRVLALSFNVIGRQVGRLSALSTLGSVLGTVLTGYVIVPLLPNSVTMLLTAALLFGISIGYFLVWGRGKAGKVAILVILGLGLGGWAVYRDLTIQLPGVNQLYRANSNFGLLQVVERKVAPRRFFLNDFLVQNTYDPQEKKSTSLFTYMLRYLAEGYHPDLRQVLCIGLGVGIVPMELAEQGIEVDAVEINPGVVEVGKRFFDFDPAQINLVIGDGRYFVNRTEKQYDAVILDAFLGDSSPSHLMTREAFTAMKDVLQPGGVLVINSFGDFQPGKNFFVSSLHKTLSAVFPSVEIHATGNGNVFFVASTQTKLQLQPVDIADAHYEVSREVAQCLASNPAPDPRAGLVLTDDYNPVDFYDAQNREEHRRSLAQSLRRL